MVSGGRPAASRESDPRRRICDGGQDQVNKTERDKATPVAGSEAGASDAAAADVAANQAACSAGGDVVEEEDTQRASYWIDRLSQGLPAGSHCALDGPPSAPLK